MPLPPPGPGRDFLSYGLLSGLFVTLIGFAVWAGDPPSKPSTPATDSSAPSARAPTASKKPATTKSKRALEKKPSKPAKAPAPPADDSADSMPSEEASSAESPSNTTIDSAYQRDKWQILYTGRPTKTAKKPLPLAEGSLLELVDEFSLKAPADTDPYWLGTFTVNGSFGRAEGYLQRTEGKNALIKLGEAEHFELEGKLLAEGLGGWFLLIGWNDGHGYAVSNVTLKKSGSPWHVAEYRGATLLRETLVEVNRYEWKGTLPLRLSVLGGKLNLTVDDARLAKELALDNYHGGAVYLGTYDTPYGPRDVKVQSLRMRTCQPREKQAK